MTGEMELMTMLEPVRSVAVDVAAWTKALLRGLLLAVMAFSGLRAALLQGGSPVRTCVQALLCVTLIEYYETVFGGVVELGDALTRYLRGKSSATAYFEAFVRDYHSGEQRSWYSELWAIGKAAFTETASVGAYAFAWAGALISMQFSALCLALLYALGPLWLACGVIGRGNAIPSYFSALVRVLAWTAVPSFALLVIGRSDLSVAFGDGSVSRVLVLNYALGLASLASPLIVNWLIQRGPSGIGEFAFQVGLGIVTRSAANLLSSRVGASVVTARGAVPGPQASAPSVSGAAPAPPPPQPAANPSPHAGLYQPRLDVR